MTDKAIKGITTVVDSLNDKEVAGVVSDVRGIDPISSLRTAIFDSFKKRLEIILDEEKLKSIIESKLISKIETDEVTVPQLISLLNATKQSSTFAMDSLLSVLKPVPNSVSPLFATMNTETESGILNSFENVTPTEAENLGKLIRLMNRLAKTDNAE
jgi:hypothetical protein